MADPQAPDPQAPDPQARHPNPDQTRAEPTAAPGLEARATEVAALLKVLAHPARLMLACTLAEGTFSVSALEARLGIRQPSLSQHLGVLRAAGVTETRRVARQIHYRLSGAPAAALIAALHDIYCREGDGDE